MALAHIHATAIVESGVRVGDDTAVWDGVHIRHNATIGEQCIIGEKTYIAYDVTIGNRVKINAQVYICTGVEIDDGCLIAAHVVFTNDKTPRATDVDLRRLLDSGPTATTPTTRVGHGASLGANATIGPGLQLGAYCVVGMGAVVTRDVPPHGLVVGNPAQLIGLVARNGERVWTAKLPGQLPPPGTVIACPDDGELQIDRDGVRFTPGT